MPKRQAKYHRRQAHRLFPCGRLSALRAHAQSGGRSHYRRGCGALDKLGSALEILGSRIPRNPVKSTKAVLPPG